MNKFKNEGFSLIELVIVIAVLAILSILSGPYFLRLINLARFESAKNHMKDSFTSCINAPNISPSNPYIPGVAFQSSNCSSLMSATIDNSCTISMDMSNGAKTGWNNSYDECTSASNTASNNNSFEENVNGDGEENGNGNENYSKGIVYKGEFDEYPVTTCVSKGELEDYADWGIEGGEEWGWNEMGQAVITTKNASTGEEQDQICRALQNGENPFE